MALEDHSSLNGKRYTDYITGICPHTIQAKTIVNFHPSKHNAINPSLYFIPIISTTSENVAVLKFR